MDPSVTTITATQLRHNFDDVMKRVAAGEEIVVTHRFYPPFRILQTPDQKPRTQLKGLEALLRAARKYSYPKNISWKELYHQHLEEKYGKK